MSSFFEFNIATTGLFAAKAGLQVTSNNVSNMSTQGYSRQYVKQKASNPLERYAGIGQVGTGTEAYGIGQFRDVYLDKKYWTQSSTYSEFQQKSVQLGMMENIFSELSKTGLTSNVNGFFDSISDLAFGANDLNYRSAVVNTADTLVTNVKNHANKLLQQQVDLNDEIYSVVQKINSIGSQLVSINEQIYKIEIDGQTANELRDQRTLLLDELSKYVNIETKEVSDGTGRELGKKFFVLVNGQEFVNHVDWRKLNTTTRPAGGALHPNDAPNLFDIEWANGDRLNLNSLQGELKGLLDIRDGDSGTGGGGNYKGIPFYVDKLNQFVRTMARAMNTGERMDGTALAGVIGHINGFDMNGNAGGLFFSMVRADGTIEEDPAVLDYNSINAFNFSLSGDIKANPSRLATSDTNDPTQVSNNKVILGFLKLKNDTSLFSEGGALEFVNSIASTLGIDTKQANDFNAYYKDIVKKVDNQRMQVSGVSLNEEVANIVKYQHLYQTASKLMNVINEIYNTTINGLGV